ncbi:hypothetical protein [Succinivibrio dextrinosolvens]|uniref:hypothetical protein n=1 Tax=Succinivibrio dextrinosolvens TaxID=83771 RepID=UPI0019244E15|nr:hypothetical protein [Succinivibrio dextrinosolvens]
MSKSLSDYKVRLLPAAGLAVGSIRSLVRIILDDNNPIEELDSYNSSPVEEFLQNVWDDALNRMFDIAVKTSFREWEGDLHVGNLDQFREKVLLNVAKFIIGSCYDRFCGETELDIAELVNINIQIAETLYELNVYQLIFNLDGKVHVSGSNDAAMKDILQIMETRSSAYRRIREKRNSLSADEISRFTEGAFTLNTLKI